MSDYCVIVADSTRARFFTLEAARDPELESGPKLAECKDLVNPEKGMAERMVYADTKSGRNRAPQGGPAHGYDDHRTQHQLEFERRFARTVAGEAVSMAKANRSRYLVIAAQAHMLSSLRHELDSLGKIAMEVREASTNLTKLAPGDIQEHLAKQHLLPACRKPGQA